MFKQPTFFLLAVFLFSFCNSPLKSQLGNSNKVPDLALNKNGEATNKIVFLTYEVSLTDSARDEYDFTLVNKQFSTGTLKKDMVLNEAIKDASYLYYEFGGTQEKPARQYKVLDPLKVILEYPEDNGALGKTTIFKKKGELTIRFQYDQSLKSISIFKVKANSLTLKKTYDATL